MRMSASQLPHLTFHAFIVNEVTHRLKLLKDTLTTATRNTAQLRDIPRSTLSLRTTLSLSRVLRETSLSRGLCVLVDDLVVSILRPELHTNAQLLRHHNVVDEYEITLDDMKQARTALIHIVEEMVEMEDGEGVIGDPVEVGAGKHVLTTAMYGASNEEDQFEVVLSWMREGRQKYLREGGMEK